MKILISTLFLLFLSNCAPVKTVSYAAFENGGKVIYKMQVPRGYTKERFESDHGDTQLRLLYSDSSVIFITNASEIGNDGNTYKFEKYGSNASRLFVFNDTLLLDGVNQDGLHWKEEKKNQIVYGYLNVFDSLKAQYEQALKILKRIEK